MPWYEPPERPPGRARTVTLKPGQALWRVHSDAFAPLGFNPTDPDAPEVGGGGRFDSIGGDPPYMYAATTPRAAIAETLLRDVPFDARGARELPGVALRGRSISELEVVSPVKLVALHGEGLSRVGQDSWLVRCDSAEYGRTRCWSSAMHDWYPGAAGLQWRARHDDDSLALCLYDDRMAPDALEVRATLPLGSGEGFALVRASLLAFGVAPPRQ